MGQKMINNKKVLVVVTARAGSKGLPGKNYKYLLGQPLFIWSMLAGLKSKYVDKVVLSSNCHVCASIFCDFLLGVYQQVERGEQDTLNSDKSFFIARPEEFSTDTSKNEEALIHVMNTLKTIISQEYDIIVNLQPTSPCRMGGLLDSCLEAYSLGGYDSLLTATKETPFFWRREGDNKWIYNIDYNNCCDRKMRQQFKENEFLYHDCGNIYIVDSRILLDKRCRIGYNPMVFEISGMNGLQIDTEWDFELIETMAKNRNMESLV